MSSSVEINGKVFDSVRSAAKVVSYAPDYVTRLARERKILAVRIGRSWYIQIDSLRAYAEVRSDEQLVRQKHLRRHRQLERQIKTGRHEVPVRIMAVVHEYRIIGAISGVVLTGVLFGFFINSSAPIPSMSRLQAGIVSTLFADDASKVVEVEEDAVLAPVFLPQSEERVHVSGSRVVPRPEAEKWQRIEYD